MNFPLDIRIDYREMLAGLIILLKGKFQTILIIENYKIPKVNNLNTIIIMICNHWKDFKKQLKNIKNSDTEIIVLSQNLEPLVSKKFYTINITNKEKKTMINIQKFLFAMNNKNTNINPHWNDIFILINNQLEVISERPINANFQIASSYIINFCFAINQIENLKTGQERQIIIEKLYYLTISKYKFYETIKYFKWKSNNSLKCFFYILVKFTNEVLKTKFGSNIDLNIKN